jgi:hypothetical protein
VPTAAHVAGTTACILPPSATQARTLDREAIHRSILRIIRLAACVLVQLPHFVAHPAALFYSPRTTPHSVAAQTIALSCAFPPSSHSLARFCPLLTRLSRTQCAHPMSSSSGASTESLAAIPGAIARNARDAKKRYHMMLKTVRNARTPSSGDQPDGAPLDAVASVQLCKEGISMAIGTSH